MKNQDQILNKVQFREFRRRLRNNLTPAEAVLWRYLKNKQLENRRFRRQFSVGKYVLDFYCPAEKLGVELYGEGHFSEEGKTYDAERGQFINHLGIRIIRFENEEVFEDIKGVLDKIKSCFRRNM
ncbi:MAG TPA: DUF559 domain-containing protein [Cyclobacteriaceae bacterium]|nr:DUF559 domain-containing protein [Cyclobacteriaceae bacterium]